MENIVTSHPLTTLATVACCIIYFAIVMMVGSARFKYNVKAPATTGNLEFEKRFRVQMNTLEGYIIFFPTLWICAFLGYGDFFCGVCGFAYAFGRIIYAFTYVYSPEARVSGFLFYFLSQITLLGAASITATKAILSK